MAFLHLSAQCAGHQHNDFIQIIKKKIIHFLNKGWGPKTRFLEKYPFVQLMSDVCSILISLMFNFCKPDVKF